MTPETLVCALNIAPERLSALRDDALASDDAQQLREHVSGCAACQARLADYDALAAALRQQRELEPGERIVEGVRARLAAPTSIRRRLVSRPSPRFWKGLAALAPVAAIILLFVYVFSGLAGRGRPAVSKTPIVSAPTPTLIPGKKIAPTATPALVTLPPFTASVTTAAAWGTPTPVATVQAPTSGPDQYSIDALAPDGSLVAGTAMPIATPTSGWPRVDLVSYDIAGGAWKRLGPHWEGYVGPAGGVTSISSRYIIYSYNDGHGQTCGVCHNSTWAYDRQTGAIWQVDPKAGELSAVDSGDHVAIQTPDMQIWVSDIASHHMAQAIPQSEQTNTDIHLMGFTWPYLIYVGVPAAQPGETVATTLRIRNMQTNTTTILPTPLEQILSGQSGPGVASFVTWAGMVGDTLYFASTTLLNGVDIAGAQVNTGYTSLYRVSHVFTSGAGGPELLARWQVNPDSQTSSRMAANDRLIVLDSDYVWDIAEGRMVRLTPTGGNAAQWAVLAGNYLMLTQSSGANSPQLSADSAAIYDTTTFATR